MGANPPVVYILHGDDEYAITQYIAGLKGKLGDSAMAEMNIARLDGRSLRLQELETAASTMPFMVKRRLVIVTNPLASLNSSTDRKKFTTLLASLTPAAAVVLVEYRPLTSPKERREGKPHWLEKWGKSHPDQVYVKEFTPPKGMALARRVQGLAKEAEGQITTPAAELLVSLVGDSPRLAVQELEKLLVYVNYARPIDTDDVEHLTADQGQGDIFAMVDAIGNRDGRRALNMLHRLLSEKEPLSIFGMVVRQFRLLIIAREVMNDGGQIKEVSRILKLPSYAAEKVSVQARRFNQETLEAIYHRLLDIDVAVKNGEVEGSLALDTLIVAVTESSG